MMFTDIHNKEKSTGALLLDFVHDILLVLLGKCLDDNAYEHLEQIWLVSGRHIHDMCRHLLNAFHQSQAKKNLVVHSCSILLGNTFGFRQQGLERCGLCPISLHFSGPQVGGRLATVVQIVILYIVYLIVSV